MAARQPVGILPVHPQPIPGESFGSWFVRTAKHNAMHLLELKSAWTLRKLLIDERLPRGEGPPARPSTHLRVDPDVQLPPRWERAMVDLSGVEDSKVRRLAINAAVGMLPWLPRGLTVDLRFPRGLLAAGYQVCPLCLAEGKEPFLRLEWRLTVVSYCVKHSVFLSETPRAHGPLVREPNAGSLAPWMTRSFHALAFGSSASVLKPPPELKELVDEGSEAIQKALVLVRAGHSSGRRYLASLGRALSVVLESQGELWPGGSSSKTRRAIHDGLADRRLRRATALAVAHQQLRATIGHLTVGHMSPSNLGANQDSAELVAVPDAQALNREAAD